MTRRAEDAGDLAARLRAVAEPENLTDLGNALRLVRLHGAELRHCQQWKAWRVWDRRRWAPDHRGQVARHAKATVCSIYAEASAADDEKERKAIAAHARRSESRRHIDAMVALAASEDAVAVEPAVFDADPWLFNVANGTVNLRDGELLPHQPDHLITKLAPVDYLPDASHPDWDRLLRGCMAGDVEMIEFLQRICGYTLTGLTSEEKLFFLHGPEATGKTTFVEALKAMMGDYATTADFEVFTKRQGDRGATNDLARLNGARLVAGVEVDEGKRLAEGLVKTLTGGDTVTARHLYAEYFEFAPTFKLWLAANARPAVNAADGAMWRRIVQIPFVHQVAEGDRDPELKRRAKSDPQFRSAVLSWAVRGCLDWRSEGSRLQVPETVKSYTDGYREENEPLRDWITDSCELGPGLREATGDLRRSYNAWAESVGEKPVDAKRWAAALEANGCHQGRTAKRRLWHGIAIRRGPR